MLSLPDKGMARSVNAHNINLDALCDWIEGCVLFDESEISRTDVVDILLENGIYDDQAFASEIVENAWSIIENRLSWLGDSSPIEFKSLRASRVKEWKEIPAHSFCLTLSFSEWYSTWASGFAQDFTEQGELFEQLTKESMAIHFPEWKIHSTGWTRNNPIKLGAVLKDIVDLLGEILGNVERWADESANEAGLDLLCYRSFPDDRVGKPVFLMQCASGKNWQSKLHTPDLTIWTKIIDWAAMPQKAFSMPFALSEKEFIKRCNNVKGLLLDRYRLLASGYSSVDWLSNDLKEKLIAWVEPRIAVLPKADK